MLDASFLIDVARNRSGAPEILASFGREQVELIVPAQAAAEQLAGTSDILAGLRRIESSFVFAEFDREHVAVAAELAQRGRRLGAFPGWADIQIAASARLAGTYVVTANPRHFAPLRVDHWDYRNAEEPVVYEAEES